MAINSNGMRGTRLGSTSYENDSQVFAPRLMTKFICPDGHKFEIPFYIEADEIPDTWECSCSQKAIRADLVANRAAKGSGSDFETILKTPKTHFDQLMERRSKADLQDLLKERIALIRPAKKAS